MKTFILRTLLAIGAVALIAVVITAVCVIRLVTTCEINLHKFRAVNYSIVWYIDASKGGWPRSWADLQKYGIPQKMGGLTPKDYEELAAEVFVDFTIDPDKVDFDDPKAFTGIRAPEPCYEHDRDIADILYHLKKYHDRPK